MQNQYIARTTKGTTGAGHNEREMMNLKKIVEQWLRGNKFEGLYGDICGCEVDDLMPCDEPSIACKPGFKVPCPGPEDCENDGGCPWHIGPTKAVKGKESDE